MKIGTKELVIGGILLLLFWPKKNGGTKPATPRSTPGTRPEDTDTATKKDDPAVAGCQPYHATI